MSRKPKRPRTKSPLNASPDETDASVKYVSRGGFKLAAALAWLEAKGWSAGDGVAADLGCSVGGFTDCLLQHGAARVHAVDTAYGQLAWSLRQDERVIVHERSNALHLAPPEICKVVVVDLGWTKQDRAVPTALQWLGPPEQRLDDARVISLIKPHYESGEHQLDDAEALRITHEVADTLPRLGVTVDALIESPIRGGKGGNPEWLAILRPVQLPEQ